ncbi:hypothetical protein N0V92_000305 [Colletotrichum tropicale]|nr:hypothetical protein N0V92_000305 [Colletotrichum tropicale]
MRSYQSASALLALLATTASAVTPARLHCLRSRNVELSRLSGCGMAGSVAACLFMIPDDVTQADLETCWINSGCDFTESMVEAQWALDRCDEYGNIAQELKIRHFGVVQARATTDTTAAETTTTAATAATTASAATTTTAASTTGTATTATGTTAASTGTGTTGTGTTATTKVCSTTTTKSTTACPVQSTGTASGKTITSGCYSTTVAFETCAAGMLCQDDSSGNPSCLVIDNNLSGAGIAVALFFAIAGTGAIALITFLCCRDRKNRKRILAKAEAAAIAKEAKLAKKPTIAVEQPLMANDGNQQPYNDDHSNDHNNGHANNGHNPFDNRNHM